MATKRTKVLGNEPITDAEPTAMSTKVDKKIGKKIRDLYVKLNKFYNSCYITRTGYVCTTERKKTTILKITDEFLEILPQLYGESFKVVKLPDIKNTKDTLDNSFEEVSDEDELAALFKFIDYTNGIKMNSEEWYPFTLSDDESVNHDKINAMFLEGESVEFNPKGAGVLSVIMHKSFLPYVSETNYENLTYTTKEANEDIVILIFRFEYSHFEVMWIYHCLQM